MTQNRKRCNIYLMMLAMLGLSVNCRASLTGGYMQVTADCLTYLRLTQAGSQLNGYVQFVQASVQTTEGFTVKQLPVSGVASGQSFSLTRGIVCEGTRMAGKVTLQFPDESGRTSTCILNSTPAKAWNQAVLTFERECRIKAYANKWDNALWNRQEQITNDLEEAQWQVADSRLRLSKHQSQLEANVTKSKDDLKYVQKEIAADNAEIAAACIRVEEDNIELNHYLFGHVIYGMLDELDKGFVLGTAVRDTEIREHPCSTSDALYTVSLGKEVPVLTCGWDFRPVLLDDGKSLGWIPAKDIRVSVRPYQASKQNRPAKADKRNVSVARKQK